MPRPPNRPNPNFFRFLRPESPSTEPTPVPALFWDAVVEGLLRRLERKTREKWLRPHLLTLQWTAREACRRFGERWALEYVVHQLSTARRPREASCDPFVLLVDYNRAARLLKQKSPFTKRWRNPDAQGLAVAEAAQRLLQDIATTTETQTRTYEGRSYTTEVPRFRCAHTLRTTLSPDCDRGLRHLRSNRSLIFYVLAHAHNLTVHQLRHHLDKGAKRSLSTTGVSSKNSPPPKVPPDTPPANSSKPHSSF